MADDDTAVETETEIVNPLEGEVKPPIIPAAEDEAAEDDDEVTVSIGEVSPPSEDEANAPVWVKDLRKSHKEQAKLIRELQARVQQSPQQIALELGQKPTLENCDYDADKFESELTAFHERRRAVEQQSADQQRQVAEAQQAWQNTLSGYAERKEKLKVKDYSEAEDFVKDTLSVIQQGIILQGANDAALVVYALGKNKTEASRLAKIADPVKFAFEVARLEGKLKVTSRKPPPPEKIVRKGGSSFAGATDGTLERLRSEAEKTGNYSKVVQYKRQLKEKSA
jgi:hypothetical protein